jgi:23S rRNA-/tRNA-specific pseudouridylate synthase
VSLVELQPRQGRHHQIRAHLRSACAPILFDQIYGRAIPREITAGAPCARLALHALRLVLPHITAVGRNSSSADPGRTEVRPYEEGAGDRLVIDAPLAPDLVALGAWLDATWQVESITS